MEHGSDNLKFFRFQIQRVDCFSAIFFFELIMDYISKFFQGEQWQNFKKRTYGVLIKIRLKKLFEGRKTSLGGVSFRLGLAGL
jgi:hypothetical protein